MTTWSKAACKFRARCDRCGQQQRCATTEHTSLQWMRAHRTMHALADAEATQEEQA